MAYLDPKTGLTGTAKPKTQQQPMFAGLNATLAGPSVAANAFETSAFPKLTAAPSLTPAAPPQLAGLITADPLYAQTRADIDAARAADRSQLGAQRQRAFIEYGDVPDFGAAAQSLGLGDFQDDVTDTVRQLAAANKFSTKERIRQAHADAVKSTVDSLTARGILSSGETGYQLGRQNQRNEMANADAVQQLLDYLLKAQTGYSQSENARLQALAAAADAAAGRIPPTTASDPAANPALADVVGDVAPTGDVVNYNPGAAGLPTGPPKTMDGLAEVAQQLGATFASPYGVAGGAPMNVVNYNPGAGGLPTGGPKSVPDIAAAFAAALTPKKKQSVSVGKKPLY